MGDMLPLPHGPLAPLTALFLPLVGPAQAQPQRDEGLCPGFGDTAGDPARVQTNVWMQMSKDRGATWSAPVRLTPQSSPRVWYGDYEGLAAGRGIVLPVWTFGNGSLAETWTAVVRP